MALWTFVLEVGGGTYVSQLRALSLVKAVKEYRSQLLDIAPHSARISKQLAESPDLDEPVALERLKNVWCVSSTVGSRLALLNIIRTAN